ncbi:hypothetical protein [Virgisporangium aurantiacum]|uniref:Uncharacterized protein n=1 Tax=Virgisporangium aurantiacum TaxID=175570 RepID=A0A8J3YVL3_9ACTN|nr:hypothetical protein [Virgisporangium aurantiacum]GIJ52729.1 hypothetical protein Vau01_002450 [Virgisporangium aurantiacum]
MSEPLAQALRISGASMIMLTSIDTRTTVWSAGLARVGADVAALGAAITEAAAEMVRLTAGGSIGSGEMDDLLVTSPANFHVLRVVDGQVAHLVLDRGAANLAMARREFRQMVETRSAPGPAPAPEQVALEGEVLPASPIDLVPADAELPRLPQRRADAAWADDPTDYQATVPTLPDWLRAAAEGPFTDDSQTLDRVVGGLRRL